MNGHRWHPASPWLGLMFCLMGGALSVAPGRSLIEQSMVWHMVVQMPMMVAAGWLLAVSAVQGPRERWLGDWNQYGLTGFIASQLITAYWMLPLAIDRAVVLPQADAFKLVSLLACGAMLRVSFARSPAVLQLYFVGYAVSMLMSTGVFLATTDRRLCNAYSLDSQFNAGGGVMALGAALGSVWALRLVGALRQRREPPTIVRCD
ncbi:MAG: hypothetical protein ABL916_03660 [Burkholderiaceae bacterium]